MIEQFVAAAMGRTGSIRSVVQKELQRLRERGYITEDPAELTGELMAKLEGQAEQARETVVPLLSGLVGSVREALDLPSRTEVLALTKALERAEAARVDAEPAEPGAAAAESDPAT